LISADPVLSTCRGCFQVVPNVACPLDSCSCGPLKPFIAHARYAANPRVLMTWLAQAPLAAHAGCTNMGIRRRTPSASGLTSVEARMTLGYGCEHGAFGLELASAQRN